MLVLALVTSCAGGTPETSETPRRDLAGLPVTPAVTATSASTAASSTARPQVTAATPAPPSPPASSSPAPRASGAAASASSPAYRVVVVLGDARGDQGLDGPAYADLREVRIEDDGTRARVTVTMGGTLPVRPASREALGIGVDLYARTTQTEGDYQLFADGGPDGWFAYLETPRGFVKYPGTFAVAGTRLVFTVPWTSLGSRTSGAFSVFADWTQGGKAGTLGGNASSRDDAPALGSTAWSR